MSARLCAIGAIALLALGIMAPPAAADNFLEAGFLRREVPGDDPVYGAGIRANKDGAILCKLVTSLGTYFLSYSGSDWITGSLFEGDYTGLAFVDLWADISQGWTLTWDQGLGTETIAHIGFGAVSDADFYPNPTLTNPADGEIIVWPDPGNPPTIEWNYGATAACDAQRDDVVVRLEGPGGQEIGSGDLPCSDLSWTPPAPLDDGGWTVDVWNIHATYRLVADGIGGPTTGDPWVLENEGWCSLVSAASHDFTAPVESKSFGGIKALYRTLP